MKSIIYILFTTALLLSACAENDQAFCECIEAGKALNEKTQEFFDRAPNSEENKEIQSLKQRKNELCEPYQNMDGDQMRALNESCTKESEK